MTGTSPALRVVHAAAIAACLAASAAAPLAGSTRQPRDRDAALRVFVERVDEYAALHRRLEGPLAPLTTSADPAANQRARARLAAAIRTARGELGQGSVFSGPVAAAFRALVADALAGRDVEAFLSDLQWEHPEFHYLRPTVLEPLPDGATHEMPVVLLTVLPALPSDLEYRIVNHDLVLWDVHADLVVDFVPAAFGPAEPTTL